MEEAKTWLVYGGALAIVLLFELAADTYLFLLSRTFVHTTLTFLSTLLSFVRAHVVYLAWGLVVGAAVIDSGLTFDARLISPDLSLYSLVIMTEPYASHDASGIELIMWLGGRVGARTNVAQ